MANNIKLEEKIMSLPIILNQEEPESHWDNEEYNHNLIS